MSTSDVAYSMAASEAMDPTALITADRNPQLLPLWNGAQVLKTQVHDPELVRLLLFRLHFSFLIVTVDIVYMIELLIVHTRKNASRALWYNPLHR